MYKSLWIICISVSAAILSEAGEQGTYAPQNERTIVAQSGKSDMPSASVEIILPEKTWFSGEHVSLALRVDHLESMPSWSPGEKPRVDIEEAIKLVERIHPRIKTGSISSIRLECVGRRTTSDGGTIEFMDKWFYVINWSEGSAKQTAIVLFDGWVVPFVEPDQIYIYPALPPSAG